MAALIIVQGLRISACVAFPLLLTPLSKHFIHLLPSPTLQAVVGGFQRDVSAEITGLLEADWAGFISQQKTVRMN